MRNDNNNKSNNNNIIKFDVKRDVPIAHMLDEIREMDVSNIMICLRDKSDGLIRVRYTGEDHLEMLGMLSALQMELWDDD